MFFDSVAYILFFPAVWLVYQFTPDRKRWAVLLTASVAFYAVLKAPLLLVAWLSVVVISYYFGLAIARQTNERRRRFVLWAGIIANVGVLCGVKYLRALAETWNPLLTTASKIPNVFLTIGVSYYTLQAVSYLIDIYMEAVEPERHFGHFGLYLGFFPKLLQGPIERAGDLLPQIKAPYSCNYDNLRSGALLFAWGLFKKAAVANRLGAYVNMVYGDVHSYAGVTLILATYMYAIQILADFSGYTDMALGVARMFNIRLTQNFNAPYRATSVADFWRRWHISFSRWILDYIFKPLQMEWRNLRTIGTVAALLVTFLFSGLWHGATWNFVVWGLLHGSFIAIAVLIQPWKDSAYKRFGLATYPARRVIQTVLTFNLVSFAWIFFRANTLQDAWYVTTHLTSGVGTYIFSVATNLRHLNGDPRFSYLWNPILMQKNLLTFLLLMTSLSIMFLGGALKKRIAIFRLPAPVRWSIYYAIIFVISYFAVHNDVGFVYFQF
jgi:D-alanyl-lipoteichoic acid acyltransferase DltB (MBOAT superfamily)